MPERLSSSFARLIELYRADMEDDDPDMTAFMVTASAGENLAGRALWGEDLSHIESETARYVDP